jgi:signal transduction histidine kinase
MKTTLLFLGLSVWWVSIALAQSASRTEIPAFSTGDVIEFLDGDYVITAGIDLPLTQWEPGTNPNMNHDNRAGQSPGDYHTMGGRFYVERADIGPGPTAIYVIGMRGNFSVSVNGTEVFRNYAVTSDQMNPWYRPFLIPVSDSILTDGLNEILVHSFSRKSVGIGRVLIGSNSTLVTHYNTRYFWHMTAPIAASFAMLVVSCLVLAIWFARKDEMELLWLSISGALWFVRNHQYYSDAIPYNYSLHAIVSVHSTYFAMAATAAFYLCYIKFPYRNWIIAGMFLLGAAVTYTKVTFALSSSYVYMATTVVLCILAVVASFDMYRHRSLERGALGFGLLLLPLASIHDVVMLWRHGGDGHATYYAVFCGPIYIGVFLVSFGKRVLEAFEDLGRSKLVLEKSVADTRAELMASEEMRRELLVDQALTSERARLMQEMHDGIGSNLTTALAVARQQDQSDTTIDVLKRALGDLKLTVDSLEPIEGDLVALIGNLRHRMARDLADAGITCKWEVEDCRPLPWLDATNALHVLRIHNEAISNILAHSNATEMRIGCYESAHNGVEGICTFVADNGDGFDVDHVTTGKGLNNIKARAHSLHGTFFCRAQPGCGTTIRLWFPYVRSDAGPHECAE